MAHFYLYIDESGKLSDKKAEFTSFCGYVGHAEEWHRVAMEWNAMRFRWQIPPVHMSQIFSPNPKDEGWKKKQEEWKGDWESKRDAMLDQFAQILRNASVICVGSVVDACAYREVAQKKDHRLPTKDSNVFSFHNAIMRSLEKIETVDKGGVLTIAIDDDPEHAWEYYSALQTLKQHTYEGFQKVKERVHAIAFSETFPGLQAADMIAWEARNFARARKGNPDAEVTDLYLNLTQIGMNQPQIYSSRWIHQIAKGTATRIKEAANETT
jgi:Protein of unknown function (DUF3800)